MKKPVCGFVAFDKANEKYYDRFLKSLRKFHSEEELPIFVWDEHKIKSYNDPEFFFRQKPIIGRQLLKDYELVIGFDVDQIITGDLNEIINEKNYDMAAPLNWNRIDPQLFGPVTVWNIAPTSYFNCGIVAMRNREFVEKWFRLCNSGHFASYKYREQDLMNIMAFYFDYKSMNLDAEKSWFGLISKGEMPKFQMAVDKDTNYGAKLICPAAPDRFPNQDMTVKVIHFAGGQGAGDKFDYYRTHCAPEVVEYLDWLIK